MSIFSHLFSEIEHDAKPLLSAAARWAETEGLKIVKEVEAEVKAQGPAEVLALFNSIVGKAVGVTFPASTALGGVALDLVTTAIARAKAAQTSGSKLRPAVLNAGIEQALLLHKGQTGDTTVAPAASLVPQPVGAH